MCIKIEWLEHSNKSFGFTPIYSPEMPETIPRWILVKKGIDTMGAGVKLVLRAILVTMIWLVILPYFTIWIWRLYFWVGDWFAFSANGLPVPASEVNGTALVNITEVLMSDPKALEQMDSFTRLVHRTVPHEYKWFSKFILDCFDGQIISAVVVVVFVAIFLLREWVLQNQDVDDGGVLLEGPDRPADGLQLDQAEIVGRLLAAQAQHQQQEVAAADGAEERNNDIDGHPNPVFEMLPQHNPPYNRHRQQGVWRNDTFNFDDHNDRRPPTLNEFPRHSLQEDFPTSGESSHTRAGYIYDPLNQTYHPDSPWVHGSSSSPSNHYAADSQNSAGPDPSDSNSGEGSSSGRGAIDNVIRTRNNQPLYWKEGVRLTYDNVFLKPDGTVMTPNEKIARYGELSQTGLSFNDGVKLLEWRAEQGKAQLDPMELLRTDMTMEEKPENSRQQELGAQMIEQNRDVLFQQTQERVWAGLAGEDLAPRLVIPPQPAVAAPIPVRRPPVAAPVAVPPPPLAPIAPAFADQNDELDDMNVEELDGILEVIGMRGSYWLLLQNSLLMSALICASLGLGVWVPYMLGKTTVLMNPINILRIPLRILNNITDPITDFLLDRIMPMLIAIITNPVTAITSRISPYVSPVLGSYLGGATLRPLENMIQEHVVPIWKAVVEEATTVAPTQAQETAKDVIKETPGLVEAPLSAGGMIYQQFVTKWNNIAYGGSSNDKFMAIAVGYAIMFVLASWYMNRTHHTYGQTIGKIAFFVAIEMVIFPLFCGVVVAVTTLPVLPGATLASRWAFYLQSPNWSIIMHWLVGTAFMFNFSVFVSICRGVVRPGVMWFIRDPNDEGFHPVREILERPVLVQLRKLGTGAMMYLTLIVLGVSMTTHSVHLLMKGVFPLRWSVDEPISDLPIDLLLFHLVVPFTFHWLNPSDRFKALFEGWWRKLAQLMRLTSFMYGKEGERFPEEEGHIVYRTWKAWLLRYRPPIPGLDGDDVDVVGSGEELDIEAPVIFVRDGGLYRVPNTDRVIHLKNRRVLVPVDSEGRALDPKEDLPGEIDPLMEIQPRGREPRHPIDPREGTVIVYAPPNFKHRLISFIVLIWTSTMSFLALSIVVPLILGRSLFALMTERHVHDVYSFAAGVYAISGIWYLQEWLLSTHRTISSQGLQSIDLGVYVKKALDFFKLLAKLIYFGVLLGFVFPLGLGLMMELFVIIPLRAAVNDNTGVIFAFSWAVGLIYMKIAQRALEEFPNNRFTIDMNRIFVGRDVAQWDVVLATRRFVLPAFGIAIFAVANPAILAWSIASTVGLEGAARAKFFRLSYPTMLLVCLVVFAIKESVVLLRGWSQYVRDQEYLVGRELHNLTEEEENAAEAEDGQEQEQQQQEQEVQQPQPQPQQQGEDQPVGGQRPEADDVQAEGRGIRRRGSRSYERYGRTYDDDIPDLEPAPSHHEQEVQGGSSSSSSSGHRLGDERGLGKYGVRPSSIEDKSDDFHEDYFDELEAYYDGEGTEGTVAGRTRFRRSQRLQAIRGSPDYR
ncbi:hypothetical protein BGZ58_009030 [Dissophora ornata]|nr:hypothetical protein BGZ58_009030 [Dissophora ornata]